MGIATSKTHLEKLFGSVDEVVFCFDGDEAGQKASWRAVENALPLIREDTRINFIFLESGEDPDSYVRKNGKEAFLNLAKNSMKLMAEKVMPQINNNINIAAE